MGDIRPLRFEKQEPMITERMRQKTFVALVILVMVTLGKVSISNIFDLSLPYPHSSIHAVQL